MMEADRLLAERLQSKERDELTDEEKGNLFMELMEKRRKHFAALRAQEKRNRPPTKAQKRTQMSTYLKHMGGYTYKQLKRKNFDEIQKLFDKEMKRVNTFVAMGSEEQESKEKKAEGSEEITKGSRKKMLKRKRAGKQQQQESLKKQKMEEDKESDEVKDGSEDNEEELLKHLVIKKDEDIAINAIPLATKLLVIVDYKLHKEEVDPLNPPPPTSDSEPKDVIEVEDTVEPEDETVPASVYETAHALVEKKGKAKDEYYGKLILDLGNEVRSSVEEETAAMENLVRKLGNAEEGAECKKLKKELEEARFSNTLLPMQNERVEREIYWTRFQTHEFYREMIHRGVVFEERPNEAIDVPVEDEESPSSEPRGSLQKVSVPLLLLSGQDKRMLGIMLVDLDKLGELLSLEDGLRKQKVKFFAATLRGPALTWWNSKVVILGLDVANQMGWTKMKKLMTAECCPAEELQRMENELWNLKVKEYNMVAYTQRFNKLALMCPRMVKPESVKIDAYIRGLSDNIEGEVTSSNPTNLNEAVCMAHKLMEQKLQARNERILEGNKQKWENFQSGNSSGHTRNRCPNKVKQEEVGEARGRAYAIKDAEPQGPNVVTGTFLLNNRYASVLFYLGSDRRFVDTRFSSMLDIDPVKIDTSYEVELADGRIVSTNTVLKGCTLNLVNHLFEIDLMPIELGTFDVIIGMDWLVKHDVVIVCGEKVVRIPYVNKTLTVKSNKGMPRLKVISCIKPRKYIERGCHLFLAHVTKKKPKEKRLEDVPIIHNFPKVFPDDLPRLPPSRQVEFRIDLVSRAAPITHAPYRLAPFGMREVSEQLQELLEKGFIRPSLSPWGAPVLFVKKKRVFSNVY
ncbi:putative reverse transcriptase domain-containing protein [Tanacetum coccineum]